MFYEWITIWIITLSVRFDLILILKYKDTNVWENTAVLSERYKQSFLTPVQFLTNLMQMSSLLSFSSVRSRKTLKLCRAVGSQVCSQGIKVYKITKIFSPRYLCPQRDEREKSKDLHICSWTSPNAWCSNGTLCCSKLVWVFLIIFLVHIMVRPMCGLRANWTPPWSHSTTFQIHL